MDALNEHAPRTPAMPLSNPGANPGANPAANPGANPAAGATPPRFNTAELDQLATMLGVSRAAILLAACHGLLFRTRGVAPAVALQVIGPGGDTSGGQTGVSTPAASEDDSFADLVRAAQTELDGIPIRRDLLDGWLFGRASAAAPAIGARLILAEPGGDDLLVAQENAGGLQMIFAADQPGAAYLRQWLQAALHQPECPLSRLALLSDHRSLALFEQWNATARAFPADATLPGLVARQAAATPDARAIEDIDFFMSYAQLNTEADRLRGVLQMHGIGPGHLVGVALERNWRLPAALLAIMRAGAAYVPLDPAFPPDRIAFMARDCRAAAVVTDRATAPSLPDLAAKLLVLDDLDEDVADQPPPVVASGSRAYVIYTSGSTGQPKGVQVHHRGVINLLCAARDAIGFTAEDRLLAVSSVSFDISVLEIFLPLISGGTVILASRREVTDGAVLAAKLAGSRATVCQATPVTWRMLIRAGWTGGDLRILCGGEAVDPELARGLIRRGNGRFWNLYGPTETTIWSSWSEVRAVEGLHVPIGGPIANTRLYVLDHAYRRVPPGVLGELWIGGVGVAHGYLDRPELTADRFRHDPFATTLFPGEPEARLYRTGDRARLLADGSIEFHGRLDQQVKLRGYRIELGDVEAALADHPGLHEVAVVLTNDAAGEPELTAYVVAKADPPPASALRDHVRARLPDYMVPGRMVVLDALPLTPNGKVDRKLLPVAAPLLVESHQTLPPRSATEARLVQLWEEVLGVSPIGVKDDFFALGGHSLRAVRLLDLIQREFGVQLHLNTLYFQGATPEYLASILSQPGARAKLPYLLPLQQDGGEGPPLFCLHTLGNVGLFHYRKLADKLRGRVRMWGVLAQGLEDGLAPATSVSAMARHCLVVLRGQQPHGPYRLCGFSNAGLVAYEVATMLRDQNETVDILILLDSEGTNSRRRLPHLQRRAAQLGDWLAGRQGAPEDGRPPGIPRRVQWSHRMAMLRYRPRRYDGKVLLLAADATIALYEGGSLGWDRVASRLETVTLSTDHNGLVREPTVGLLAAELARRLDPRSG